MRSNLGNTAPRGPSPLPQEAAGSKVQAVRIVNGFTAALPGRSRTFFQRLYFASMPRPIIVAAGSSLPRPVPVCRIQAPQRQGIVLRSADVAVYEHSGIGIDDITQVPPSRIVSYFGFSLKIGSRAISDFNTNAVNDLGGGAVIPPSGNQANVTAGVAGGQVQVYPMSGRLTPSDVDNFAAYAMPGDEINVTAFVLRLPPYDVRLFSVQLSGWIVGETELQKIIDALSG